MKKKKKKSFQDKVAKAIVNHAVSFAFGYLFSNIKIEVKQQPKKQVSGKQIDNVQDIPHEVISTTIKNDQDPPIK